MAKAAVLFRIMPRGVETDVRAIQQAVAGAVPAGVTVRGSQIRDVAFGLKSLLVSVVMDDAGGFLESTEHALAKLPEVESVEVMEEGLL